MALVAEGITASSSPPAAATSSVDAQPVLASHQRAVALTIVVRERPDVDVGTWVDVHGIDPATGGVSLLVDGAQVVAVDAEKLVVAVDQLVAPLLSSASGLGRIYVVRR